MNFKSLLKSSELYIKKNSPAILTAIGVLAAFTSTILAIKATKNAANIVKDARKKKEDNNEKFTIIDEAKVSWKYYIPTVIAGTSSVACIIIAHRINVSRELAYLAAFTASNLNMKKIKESVAEHCSEEEQKKIFQRVDDLEVKKCNDIPDYTQINGEGLYLCYDEMFGRYFKSDINSIKSAVNEINRRMRDEMKMSLNELYIELGLETISIGDELGWNIDQGYLDVSFDSSLSPSGIPVIVMQYCIGPLYNYGLDGYYGM